MQLISLLAKLAPPAVPPPKVCAELVKNGDFEQGMKHWSYWEDPPGTETSIDWYFRVYSPRARVGKSCLYQTIQLPPGTYSLKFNAVVALFWRLGHRLYGFQPMPITVRIWDGEFDPVKPALWERTWRDTSWEDGTWHWIGLVDKITVTSSEPEITLGFWFEDTRSDEAFVWYVDNVRLHLEEPVEVPLPVRPVWPWILAPIVAGSTKIAVSK